MSPAGCLYLPLFLITLQFQFLLFDFWFSEPRKNDTLKTLRIENNFCIHTFAREFFCYWQVKSERPVVVTYQVIYDTLYTKYSPEARNIRYLNSATCRSNVTSPKSNEAPLRNKIYKKIVSYCSKVTRRFSPFKLSRGNRSLNRD